MQKKSLAGIPARLVRKPNFPCAKATENLSVTAPLSPKEGLLCDGKSPDFKRQTDFFTFSGRIPMAACGKLPGWNKS